MERKRIYFRDVELATGGKVAGPLTIDELEKLGDDRVQACIIDCGTSRFAFRKEPGAEGLQFVDVKHKNEKGEWREALRLSYVDMLMLETLLDVVKERRVDA
jgi:hypothetical protein